MTKFSKHIDKKHYRAAKITGPTVNLDGKIINIYNIKSPYIIESPHVCLVLETNLERKISTVYNLWIKEYLSPVYTILYRNTVFFLVKISLIQKNDDRQWFSSPGQIIERYLLSTNKISPNDYDGLLYCENVEFIE